VSESVISAGGPPLPQVEVHDDIDAIAAEWDELARATGASPFARPGWIGAWWSAFGRGELELLALHAKGRLRGVLPLERRDGVLKAPANAHTPTFELIAEDAAAGRELVDVALALTTKRLELRELDADGPTAAAMTDAARRRPTPVRVRELRQAPWVRLGAGPEDYPASLAGKRRRDLRRRRRRLDDAGEVQMCWHDGHERLDELLAEGFALEGSGWKEGAGTAIASTATTLRFYEDTARWAAMQGLLRIGFLRLDGRPVAFQLTLWDDHSCYLLKTGFDRRYHREAPGILLLDELVARAHALGLETVELLGDSEPHKMVFAQGHRSMVRAQAFAPTLSGRFDRVARGYARPLARRGAAAVDHVLHRNGANR
jgi:CelD/BcsL family acetyltransferase involved in cellulose biosynthesis